MSDQPHDERSAEGAVVPAPSDEPQGAGVRAPLEALGEVPLRLEVRLGETTLLIRDVLGLGPGSIVTLNKRPDESVDLVAGERLIARGEIVVVDGELGVRIVEIAPLDRRPPGEAG
jgi:flagellar motor switch protein FliN/FliY